jgi:WD40 repeat protein
LSIKILRVWVWLLNRMKCRGTLRGHVDSVNAIQWQLYTSLICTASSDKTVSLWDARSSLCVQTFYGHKSSCNHATFDNKVNTPGLFLLSVRLCGPTGVTSNCTGNFNCWIGSGIVSSGSRL